MAKEYEDNYSDYSTTKINYGTNELLKKIVIISGAVIFVLLIIVFAIIFIFSKPNEPIVTTPVDDNKTVSSSTPRLPGDNNGENNGSLNGGNGDGSTSKAESLFFADFYNPEKINLDYQVETYDLPINSKSDVLNFYYVSKRMGLDPYLESLDNDGVAIMDNLYGEKTNDFYSVYGKLNSEGIPMFLTSDFIIYYYQNITKESFKEIEKSVFYENLWNIAKRFYEISSTRYRKDFALKGIVNDPVLEGERLEAAYFAVILELLKPTQDQINRKTNFSDDTKFSEQEASEFDYVLLDYLKSDVTAEVELIRAGVKTEKSPVFFYEKNYKEYNIPSDYSNNAKLNNFYLVTKWMNSVFPLYYQDNQCPECLLDREDWRISMAAANFIARDFFENQDLKNDWASIYKIISFFTGLRQDLTYLHFYESFNSVFENRSIEEVFSRENESWEEDYKKYINKILSYKFSAIEGSFDREDASSRDKIGMRILQENYWPNDFIFSSLTGDDLSYNKEARNEQLKFTACDGLNNKNIATRCVATGLDVINLVYPLSDNKFYIENTKYSNFSQAQKYIDNELLNFNKYSWQSNNYWSTLDTINVYLNSPKQALPVFMNSEKWQQKDLNAALGTWVNLHLAADKFVLNNSRTGSSFNFGTECNKYNYIEPNIHIVNELIAKNSMLRDMLVALSLTEKTNVVSGSLKELNENLEKIRYLIAKELRNEALEKTDCDFIEEFVSIFETETLATKEYSIKFGGGVRLKEYINGVKLLAVVKSFGESKAILVGPIFDYQEKR